MRYDLIGSFLLATSALLYASRYLAAAVFMGPGLNNWGSKLFKAAYRYVGNGLTIWALISLIAGIACIAVGIVRDSNKRREIT